MLPPRTTVVGFDFSPAAESALAHAIAWTRASGNGGRVTLVHAEPIPYLLAIPSVAMPPIPPEELRDGSNAERARLRAVAKAHAAPGLQLDVHSVPGSAAAVILDAAESGKADLVAVGANSSAKLKHFLLGSVAESVAREASGPVLVVDAGEPRPKQPIVVGVDLSSHSAAALRDAVALGKAFGAPVHAVTVLPSFVASHSRTKGADAPRREAYERAEKGLEKLRAAAGGDVAVDVREGDAATELLARAEELDAGLVVVSRRGMNPLDRLLLGSVAQRVLRKSPRPVLVVPRAKVTRSASAKKH